MRRRNAFSARTTATVGLLLGMGMLATMAREILMAGIFGTGRAIEHFRLAFAVPNLLGTSLATVVVAAMSPGLSRLDSQKSAEGAALRHAMQGAMILALGLGGLGLLTVPVQVNFMAPGYDELQRSELSSQVTTLWFFFVLVAVSFGPRAFLTVRAVTWPMASSNLLLSGTMVIGLWVLSILPGRSLSSQDLSGLAIAAAAVVLLVHLTALPRGALRDALRSQEARSSWVVGGAGLAVLAALVGHVLGSFPRLIDRSVATEFAPGTVAAMDFSFAVMTLPGVAFGTVFIMSALPGLARAIQGDDRLLLRRLAIFGAICIASAAAVGLLLSVNAKDFVRLVFQRGAFDSSDAELTASLLRWHALALGPMVASLILMQVLLTADLLKWFLAISALRVATKMVAIWALTPEHGIDGLAATFLAPEVASCIAAAVVLAVRLFGQTAVRQP